MAKVKFGIIGCGKIAERNHVPGLLKNAGFMDLLMLRARADQCAAGPRIRGAGRLPLPPSRSAKAETLLHIPPRAGPSEKFIKRPRHLKAAGVSFLCL